jgi:AsmA family protein
MAARREGGGGGRRWVLWAGLAVLALVGLGVAAVASAGPLLRPLVEARASAALGRPVSIGRLRIAPGRITTVTAEDVIIANPPDFPAEAAPWLARVPRLTLDIDAGTWLGERSWVLPRILLDRPEVQARALEDGRANYLLDLSPAGEAAEGEESGAAKGPRIGALQIREGRARIAIARLAADFELAAATVDSPGAEPRIEAEARGTYAGQPIAARLEGGAVLNLRDAERPWPVRLDLENGPTRATLEGTLRDPLALRGADLALTLAGPDMALLAPLTGVPFPTTTPFRLTGRLDYAAGRVRFLDAEGQVGNSDIAGGITVTTGGERPVVAAELRSRRVDLADLGGLVGVEPGRRSTPGQTPEQRERLERARSSPRLLPDRPISLPRLRAADVHVDYSAERIQGRGIPFDGLVTQFDVQDGAVDVKRLVFPIGGGQLAGRFVLTPREDDALHARGEIELQRVDFSRLVGGTAGVRGSGRLGGVGRIEGTGRSLAEILGRGDGEMTVAMVGGALSAFLVDLSGLQFGKALLSALGLPEREPIECLIGDFALRRGTLSARTLLMDTESAVTTGEGRLDLGSERLALRIRTESKRLSVGTLPAPIQIAGTLKNPSVGPEAAELAARAGAAVGLGVLLPPLALLPTIQLGVGENSQCERLQGRGRRRGGAEGGGAR